MIHGLYGQYGQYGHTAFGADLKFHGSWSAGLISRINCSFRQQHFVKYELLRSILQMLVSTGIPKFSIPTQFNQAIG